MKKQNNYIVKTLVAIIIMFVVVGGYYIYNHSTKNFQTISTQYSVSGNTLSVVDNGKIIQTLSLSKDGLGALNIMPSNNAHPFITDTDLNFDGHNDVGVLVGTGYGGVNYFYDFYLFNPSTNMLEKNNVLTEFVLTSINPDKKQIFSTYKSGPGYITDTYQWNGSTFLKINSTNN
jgi:hypothetical protein